VCGGGEWRLIDCFSHRCLVSDTFLGQVSDEDEPVRGDTAEYSIAGGDPANNFIIDPRTGFVFFGRCVVHSSQVASLHASIACLLLYEDFVWVSLGNAMKAKQSKVASLHLPNLPLLFLRCGALVHQ
jgi:hypothetical protein